MAVPVKVNERRIVKPAEPAWEGCLTLSEIDQIGSITHVPVISFYPAPPEYFHKQHGTISNVLKESLSRALVTFYPLAGRLRWIEDSGNRLELDCNGKGAEFIEAESESRLDDFGGDKLPPVSEYHTLFPEVDYTVPLHEIPVTIVQLTRFACGGISLAVGISHAVTDGQAAFGFMSEWASLARGEAVKTTPYFDRKVLRAGEPATESLSLDEDPSGYYIPELLPDHDDQVKSDGGEEIVVTKSKTTMGIFRLSKDHMEKLRRMANHGLDNNTNIRGKKESVRPYTKFETLAGHVWRCACKARKHKPEQPTALGICVDSRRRVNPPLPKGFFGSATFDVTATGISGELVSKPLGHAASRIREAVKKVTSEFIWSTLDFLKSQTDLSSFRDPLPTKSDKPVTYANPNLGIVSWISLPLYGNDFGWGEEIDMVPGEIEAESTFLIPDRTGDGSMVVALRLQTDHMDSFKKYFYNDII